ncbi:MAG TPA: glycoside hydrolase, partial [Niastella sp.]
MRILILMLIGALYFTRVTADTTRPRPTFIAYYSGNATDIDRYQVQALTHIIYSFALLRNNQL